MHEESSQNDDGRGLGGALTAIFGWDLGGSGRRQIGSRRGVAHPLAIAILLVIVLVVLAIVFLVDPGAFLALVLILIGGGLLAFAATHGANPWLVIPGVIILLIGAVLAIVTVLSGTLSL